MSMSHKAYVFDYDAFAEELRPIVMRALDTRAVDEPERFIEEHRAALVDPYRGQPLDSH